MLKQLRRPSPAFALSLIALFVALSGIGTAVAAGIVAHARLADNSLKLQGKTPKQVAALVPAGPAGPAGPTGPAGPAGPAGQAPASLAGYITVKSAPWSLNANQENDFTVGCDASQKAIAGGYDNPNGAALSADTRPSSDGGSWRVYLFNIGTGAASGNVYAVCIK